MFPQAQESLAATLGMEIVSKHEKYLGLLTYVGERFAYIKGRLNKKLEGWQGNLLNGYLQAYIYDTEHELENRLSESEVLGRELVEKIQ